jgi:hypothetical protein
VADQQPYTGYDSCGVGACSDRASSPLQLGTIHGYRYQTAGRPGGARLPKAYFVYESSETPTPVQYADESAFLRWSREAAPVMRGGQLTLLGLRPLVRAEIRWGLHAHAQGGHRRHWEVTWIKNLMELCHRLDCHSLLDVNLDECSNKTLRKHRSPSPRRREDPPQRQRGTRQRPPRPQERGRMA